MRDSGRDKILGRSADNGVPVYTQAMIPPRRLEAQVLPYLRPYLRKDLILRRLGPQSVLMQIPVTLALTATVVLLHGLRDWIPALGELYAASGFRPSTMTWTNLLFCGVFHEGPGHFAANVVSLLICAGLAEAALGARLMLIALTFGFWASNPLTVLAFRPLLSAIAPEQWAHLAAEVDYGASNGIYAVVGLLAALLIRPRTVILPFIFNGVFYAFASSSWLALQHLIALFAGLWIGKYAVGRRLDPRTPCNPLA